MNVLGYINKEAITWPLREDSAGMQKELVIKSIDSFHRHTLCVPGCEFGRGVFLRSTTFPLWRGVKIVRLFAGSNVCSHN